ncbi:MAG: cache domain-containing protein, partial [Clostridium sp.]|nr:cache domain-containing protein [Clostridium sp.]
MIKIKKSFTMAICLEIFILILFTVFILGYLWIYNEYEVFTNQSQTMKNEYIQEQKEITKDQVSQTVDYINYMKKQTNNKLKNDIKERTYEEYAISMNIYNNNKNTKSSDEIKKLIVQALRNIRFNNGRGYYFIDTLDGYAVLYPTDSQVEGKNLLNLQDQKGNYSLKDEISLVNKQNEGFTTGYWTNPECNNNKVYPKIAFVKRFEPYNWYMGTGEYVSDVENDLKQETLDRIKKMKFGNDTKNYIFIDNYKGLEICNGAYPNYEGKNLWNLKDPKGTKVIQKQIEIAKNNKAGGFLTHYWKERNSNNVFKKTTYVKAVPDWNWVVGCGINMQQIEKILDESKANMQKKIYREIENICLILIGVIIFALIITKELTNRSRRNFEVFTKFLSNSSSSNEKLDISKIHYLEFKKLAVAANKMIEAINENTIKIKERNMELKKMSITDGLTGLYNHNYAYISLEAEIHKAKKFNEDFCVCMFDIDFFKKINDTFGHQVGDKVLKRVSQIIKESIGENHIAGRYGGEEFIVILPKLKLNESYEIAESIRDKISKIKFNIEGLRVTISGGVVQYSGETALEIVKKTDEKLY